MNYAKLQQPLKIYFYEKFNPYGRNAIGHSMHVVGSE